MAYTMEEFDAITGGSVDNPEVLNNAVDVSDAADVRGMKIERMDNVEGFEGQEVLVTGSPFEVADSLDCCQGDNIYGVEGDCGLVSCVNCLILAGFEDWSNEYGEDAMLTLALDSGMCVASPFRDASEWGGTCDFQLEMILDEMGIESTIYSPETAGGSIQDVAKAVENGHVVVMTLNAGILWDIPSFVDNGYANHAVTVTGTVRDTNGQLLALTICDSGSGNDDSCRVVPVELLEDCYTDVINAAVIVSDESVR